MVEREKKDIAHATEIYPVIIANPIFRNLHRELIYNVGRHMEHLDQDRTLLILGLSPVASPYADNKRWLDDIIGPKGKIIALDYNVKIISKAMAYLSEKGFFGKNQYDPRVVLSYEDSKDCLLQNGFAKFLKSQNIPFEKIVEVSNKRIDPSKLPSKTILTGEANLNYGINLADNSVDCIDATLTLHHVAAYRQQIKSALQEVYRVLRPGGMFHYGDAFYDARGSEGKINKIMNEMTHLTGLDMVMFDDRDADWKVHAEYSASKDYKEVPLLKQGKPKTEKPVVEVTPEGFIKIPLVGNLDDCIKRLDQLGYKQKEVKEDFIEIPLIDPVVEKQHIDNVYEFEDLVRELKKGLYATTNFSPELIDEAITRGDKERDIATKGIVEYFSPKEFLTELLEEVGFENIKVELPNGSIYPVDVGAILAYKPK